MFDIATLFNTEEIKQKLTENAKNDIMKWIGNKVIPTARDTITQVNQELKAQAENESGWVKTRDGFFIPLVLSILLWAFEQANEIIAKETLHEE